MPEARGSEAKNREAFLDDIENEVMAESFWDNSISPEDVYKEDKHAYAIQMWEQAINKGPKMGHMDLLNESYPQILVKKFLELLANAKEEIAVRVQRRHENIVTQLKKELRKAGAKGKKKYDDAKYTCDEIVLVLNAVRAAEKKVIESKERRHQFLYGHNQERDEMYEQMKHAMLETQQHVVEEAERGKFLTEQINELNEQNEEFRHVTDDSIRQIEDVNMDLMKNIQRLCKAIRQHEMRIEAMKKFARKEDALEEGKSSAQFFYF